MENIEVIPSLWDEGILLDMSSLSEVFTHKPISKTPQWVHYPNDGEWGNASEVWANTSKMPDRHK